LQEKNWVNKAWFAKSWLATDVLLGVVLLVFTSLPYLSIFASLDGVRSIKEVLPDLFSVRVLSLVGDSAILSFYVALLSTILGLLFIAAILFSNAKYVSRALLIGSVLLYCISPVVLLTVLQSLPRFIGMTPLWSAVVILSWSYFPLSLFIFWLSSSQLDAAGLECGYLTCRAEKVIQHVVLPQLRRPILISACIVFVITFMQSEAPSLLGYPVYAEEFLARVILEDSMGPAVMLAMPMVLMVLLILPIIVWQGREFIASSWSLNGRKALQKIVKKGMIFRLLSAACLVLIVIPIIVLFVCSDFDDFISLNGNSFVSSLILALPSVMLALSIAHFIAEGFSILGNRGRTLIIGIILAQMLLPGALLGLGMIRLTYTEGLGWLNADNALLVVTHALRILPFLTLLLIGLRLQYNKQKYNESQLFKIGWFRRQLHIRFPQERAGLLLVGSLGFAMVLSELSTTVLVIAPGTETSILRLYNLMHYGDWPAVTALALVQALFIAVNIMLVFFIGLRSYDQDRESIV
jgi:ABC-type Fe3+ transport system permease subunit